MKWETIFLVMMVSVIFILFIILPFIINYNTEIKIETANKPIEPKKIEIPIKPKEIEKAHSENVLKKDSVFGLFVRSRNEQNMEEFMNHYYKIGFRFILFVDDNSSPSIYEVIHGINIPNDLKYHIIKISTMDGHFGKINRSSAEFNQELFIPHVLPILQKHTDFVLFCDMDEYLYVNKPLHDIVESYLPFTTLKVNWLFFGNNNIKSQDNISLLLPTFTKSSENLNFSTKSLTRTCNLLGIHNAHIFKLRKGSTSKDLFNNLRNNNTFDLRDLESKSYKDVPMYLAHFYTQDTETYIKRRFFRETENIGYGNNLISFFKEYFQEIVDYLHNGIEFNHNRQKVLIETKNRFDFINRNDIENLDLCHI
jgi:hypothetical protein